MDDLHNELSSNPPLPGSYTARKGDLCAALFVDNNWYVTGKFVDTINDEESCSLKSVDLVLFCVQVQSACRRRRIS